MNKKSYSKMQFQNIFSKKKIKPIKKQKIIVDTREKNSLVASELMDLGIEVEFKHLHIGDYIVKNVVIERKTVSDFLGSMLNKRLGRQLKNMQPLKSKLLIIEGIEEQDIYNSEMNINENAIRGFILSIVLNYQIPIIYTNNYEDTAKFLKVLANKPSKEVEMGINDKPKPRNVKEQLQYILEGFPGIGPKTAKKLLTEFKTLKNIINADIEKLEELIGKKAEIFKLINLKYGV